MESSTETGSCWRAAFERGQSLLVTRVLVFWCILFLFLGTKWHQIHRVHRTQQSSKGASWPNTGREMSQRWQSFGKKHLGCSRTARAYPAWTFGPEESSHGVIDMNLGYFNFNVSALLQLGLYGLLNIWTCRYFRLPLGRYSLARPAI